MNKKQLLECERKRIQKLKLLPNVYKKIGWGLLITAIIVLIALKLIPGEIEIAKDITKKALLVSLLFLSVSRDKIEDELTIKLRAHSYSLAFVMGVIYALIQPYITYVVAFVIKPEKAAFTELDGFVILWFMLIVQLLFFYVLKATR
ncbi:hypothetical protein [Leptobacterium sp. I13]|uniref:hypothetical protein n=1 Tax=Leptobacterium meishanense TaxID=3128904 RepID=UPI0030EF0650